MHHGVVGATRFGRIVQEKRFPIQAQSALFWECTSFAMLSLTTIPYLRTRKTMTPEERNELISTYAAGYDEVMNALDGFPADSLGAHPIPGKWSAREIVHHLGDSESFSAGRLRKLLIEDNAMIQGYDQDEYASKLRYNERDMAPALDAFRSARESTLQLLRLMTEDDWQRVGTHTESGRYSTEDWLKIYAAHAHNHASQIRRLREALQ